MTGSGELVYFSVLPIHTGLPQTTYTFFPDFTPLHTVPELMQNRPILNFVLLVIFESKILKTTKFTKIAPNVDDFLETFGERARVHKNRENAKSVKMG